jgi:HSP20 family protein
MSGDEVNFRSHFAYNVKASFLAENDPWQTDPEKISGWRFVKRSHLWRPPTDVLETEDSYVILVEIAGMRGADFNVTYNQRVLSIRGTRTDTSPRKAYHQMEIAYGEFATEVQVGVSIDAAQIEATYSDGFLRVELPKAKPKKLSITE